MANGIRIDATSEKTSLQTEEHAIGGFLQGGVLDFFMEDTQERH